MKSRTVKAWCVTNGEGHIFTDTVRASRRSAILAYGQDHLHGVYAREIYKRDRGRDGVQVVKCTVTTEPAP